MSVSAFARVHAVGYATLIEALRSKILYGLVFFAFLMVAASSLFGTVTIGDRIVVIKDFGLFCLSLFSVLYAVIAGSAFVYKEINRKTIYNLLSKPLTRGEFLVGKFFGLAGVCLALVLSMGTALSGYVALFEGRIDWLLLDAYYCIFLEAVLVCALTIFFSSVVVTPLLAGLFAFSVFLVGRSCDYIIYFVEKNEVAGFTANLLTGLYYAVPQLERLNVSNLVVYGESFTLPYLAWVTVYAISYSAILLCLGRVIFLRRHFN